MLQKVRGNVVFSACFLNALFVVNVHVQIRAVLFRQRDAFLIYEGRVLDGSHTGANCVLDSVGGVRVRFHPKAEVPGLANRGLQFFQREL